MLLFRVLVFSFLFLGCSIKELTIQEINKKINALEVLISNLSPKVSREEAKFLAKSSIYYSLKLAKKYEAISSPWIQNTLVNIGIKKRGLCYEWSEDLLKHLTQKDYETIELHNIGANVGYLDEHNALAVSAKGEGIHRSIVLDAWRNSGNLYFKKINEDMKYEWKERVDLYKTLSR